MLAMVTAVTIGTLMVRKGEGVMLAGGSTGMKPVMRDAILNTSVPIVDPILIQS